MVLWLKISSREIRIPRCRARATAWSAPIESPPSRKKLSSGPTATPPSKADQISPSARSVAPRSSRPGGGPGSAAAALRRSALRSILPLGVSGSSSRKTYSAGSMYIGSRSPR